MRRYVYYYYYSRIKPFQNQICNLNEGGISKQTPFSIIASYSSDHKNTDIQPGAKYLEGMKN